MHSSRTKPSLYASAWTLLLLYVVLSPALAQSEAEVLALPPAQAERVLERYFDALRRGDVPGIREVLGCGLRAKRRAIIERPDFGERVSERYGAARMELIRYQMISRDRIWLEAVFFHPEGTSEGRRFLLQRLPAHRDAGFVICADAAGPRTEFAALELNPRRSTRPAEMRFRVPQVSTPSLARHRPDSIEDAAPSFIRAPNILP